MATRITTQSQNRSVGSYNGSAAGNSMDVGAAAITRMAREDTKWFVAGVVVLSVVLFFALPVSVLVVVDYMKMKSELQHEIRQLRKLKKELKESNEKTDTVKSADAGGLR